MNLNMLQSLCFTIRRRSQYLLSTKTPSSSQRNLATATTPQQKQKWLRPMPAITLGLLAGSGATYTIMDKERHEALLEQKHILTGMNEEHVLVATREREELAIVKEARANPELTEFELYGHLEGANLLNNFTASTLRAKGKIVVPPVVFYNQDRTEVVVVVHLGKELCGHSGIVHGGMLATLLDEGLALTAMPALPNHVGFTANLTIDYRRPVESDQWLVMRGKLVRSEGRKAYVEAWVESLDGTTKFVEAKSLYISPRSRL